MLACRWASVNDLVQNKFRSIIHLLSHDLLAQTTDRNTRWKCKICWKLTTKKPEQSQWRHSGVLTLNSKHISHYALVFLVSLLLTLNSLGKISASKKSHRSKKRWYRSFVVRKKYWFIVVRDELRTCDISKMVFFCENSLQFAVVNNFDKKLCFQISYVVLSLPYVFFQIYIYHRPFFFS